VSSRHIPYPVLIGEYPAGGLAQAAARTTTGVCGAAGPNPAVMATATPHNAIFPQVTTGSIAIDHAM
jgi:hypothetical protein